MWYKNWRSETWSQLNQPWDIIVVGGGITGAGILREATRLGLKTLLVEQRDFAWGTSSRSSKLVHGGLRYLKEGRIGVTMISVQERENLLEEGPGLIDPIGFLLANYEGDKVGRLVYRVGLTVYDLLALQWGHRYYGPQDFRMFAPHLTPEGLKGGFRYGDAQTDDARLVLRVIREAVAEGGVALNYVIAESVLRDENGRVTGLHLHDNETGQHTNVFARVVINATGAWADRLREQIGQEKKIRPLRGSHLLFPGWRLPTAQAITFAHPFDQRPVFVFPWEGATLLGTTDVDYKGSLHDEPAITPDEVAYLMAAVESQFPSLSLTLDDVIASFAGVRPIIGTGMEDPSHESRDHIVMEENGLLTVTGGKLTTFRRIALDALEAVRHFLPDLPPLSTEMPVLNPVNDPLNVPELDERTRRRLNGRYGADAPALVAVAREKEPQRTQRAQRGENSVFSVTSVAENELTQIPGTPMLWAELRWAARAEGVVHLDDLLLRRVRLGLLLPNGGMAYLPRIRAICQPELGWDNERWEKEETAYLNLWKCCYSLPDRRLIPNWKKQLMEKGIERQTAVSYRRQVKQRRRMSVVLLGTAVLLGWWYWCILNPRN